MNDETKTDDVQQKVTISSEDCENIRNYCKHFKVGGTPELTAALEKFDKEATFENMQGIKLEVCKWMLECDHESFKDSMWDAPKKAAEEVVFDLQFDKDVLEELGSEGEAEAE